MAGSRTILNNPSANVTGPLSSIDKLLEEAEKCLKQAKFWKDFNKRDLALDHLNRALKILYEDIKDSKGRVSLQADNKAQLARYKRIVEEVNIVRNTIVKDDIKADNARAGVLPTQPGSSQPAPTSNAQTGPPMEQKVNWTPLVSGSSSDGPKSNGEPSEFTTSTPKSRPVVNPKPQALHGKPIKPMSGRPLANSKAAQALTERFANLRSTTVAPAQNHHIGTQPIPTPPSFGSRVDVPTGNNALLADSLKVPDAIYSPPRGTVSSEAAELPSSILNGIFSRTNSTALSANNSGLKSPPPEELSLTAHSQSSGSAPAPTKRTKLAIPESDTITAEALEKIMQDYSILLIDIRTREEFNEDHLISGTKICAQGHIKSQASVCGYGHIMSPATICIEPDVLRRKFEDRSAEDIAGSMYVASDLDPERSVFAWRYKFDLIVCYDQNSIRATYQGARWRPQTEAERAIYGLYETLLYDSAGGAFDEKFKKIKLLEGGWEAWPYRKSTLRKERAYRPPPPKKYVTKPIQDPDEARRWEESLNNESLIRTTDDFLRRFPPVSSIPESMTAPITQHSLTNGEGSNSFNYAPSHQKETLWMSPPQRPPPIVPRTSYSGLAESDNRGEPVRVMKLHSGRYKDKRHRRYVGLQNPGNWCYGNSSLQAMFGTPGFAEDFCTGKWQDQYNVPMKKDERIKHPQLLAKMLANLFSWMDKGEFSEMEARTLMQYLHYIHQKNTDGSKKPEREIFGGADQQDAQEYFSFIIDQLHDETNRFRDKLTDIITVKDNDPKSLLHNSIDFWRSHSAMNDSIVDKYWRGLLVHASTCPRCKDHTMAFQISDLTTLGIPPRNQNLESMLAEYTALETPEDYRCDKCKSTGRERKLSFARLPDRFAVAFQRFQRDYRTNRMTKNSHRVTFPTQNLDLTPYWIGPSDRTIADDDDAVRIANEDRHFAGPFLYDCYAVICHIGDDLSHGHYIAYVRDEASNDHTDWIRFDDSRCTKVKVGSRHPDDQLERMYDSGKGKQQAYMAFYQRQGT